MADMNVEYINVFLLAATQVMKDVCQMHFTVGKPYVKATEFDRESIVVNIGVTGQVRGQVLMAMSNEVACDIASRMCMMPITELNEIITKLDELSLSALSELGNMVLGNAATVLSTKGKIVDITPPSIIQGNFKLSSTYAQNICVPLAYDENKILELDISLKNE